MELFSRQALAGLSDADLVARAQRGDQEGIAILYERYYDRVYRFVLARLGSRADAEDLAQDTFLKMVDNLARFQWRGIPFSSWLFRIAHNATVDFLRRRASRGEQVPIGELPLVASDDPEREVELRMTTEEVIRAIKRLPVAQQEVIALRIAAGLSVNETARALGKAEGTVKVTQFRAIHALRRILNWEEPAR